MLEHSFFPYPLISMLTFEKYLPNETCQNGKCVDDPRYLNFSSIYELLVGYETTLKGHVVVIV